MEDSPSTLRMWIILVYDQSSIKIKNVCKNASIHLIISPELEEGPFTSDLLNGRFVRKSGSSPNSMVDRLVSLYSDCNKKEYT